MKTFAYLRVSTAEQDVSTVEQGKALQCQGLPALRSTSPRTLPTGIVKEASADTRRSGPPQAISRRPLVSGPSQRAIDCVVVWKFDRFARSTSHLIWAHDELGHLGIRFVSA